MLQDLVTPESVHTFPSTIFTAPRHTPEISMLGYDRKCFISTKKMKRSEIKSKGLRTHDRKTPLQSIIKNGITREVKYYYRFVHKIKFKDGSKLKLETHPFFPGIRPTKVSLYRSKEHQFDNALYRVEEFLNLFPQEIFNWIVKDVEIAIDYSSNQVDMDWLLTRVELRKASRQKQRFSTFYIGSPRSGKQIRIYQKLLFGKDYIRLELIFRERLLKAHGIVNPLNLFEDKEQWWKIFKEVFAFVAFKYRNLSDEEQLLLNKVLETRCLIGAKQEFEKITGTQFDRNRHLVRIPAHSDLLKKILFNWEPEQLLDCRNLTIEDFQSCP